jgi:hypothetical protein
MILRPFGDMFSWIDAYLRARQHGGLLAYLWTPDNEHHLVLSRLLTALDVSAFHASGLAIVVAATLAQQDHTGNLIGDESPRKPFRKSSLAQPLNMIRRGSSRPIACEHFMVGRFGYVAQNSRTERLCVEDIKRPAVLPCRPISLSVIALPDGHRRPRLCRAVSVALTISLFKQPSETVRVQNPSHRFGLDAVRAPPHEQRQVIRTEGY